MYSWYKVNRLKTRTTNYQLVFHFFLLVPSTSTTLHSTRSNSACYYTSQLFGFLKQSFSSYTFFIPQRPVKNSGETLQFIIFTYREKVKVCVVHYKWPIVAIYLPFNVWIQIDSLLKNVSFLCSEKGEQKRRHPSS